MRKLILLLWVVLLAACTPALTSETVTPQTAVSAVATPTAIAPAATPTSAAPPTATPDAAVPLATPTAPAKTIITPKAPPATLTAVAPRPSGDPVRIPPDDPRIRTIGRVDWQDPAAPAFDWSGTALEARFTGPALTLLLRDGRNWYDVTIDGETQAVETAAGQEAYPLADNLSDGEHTVRITKRTEALSGAGVFDGFVLAAGHDLLPPPQPAARRINFIGDSITVGYGVLGDEPTCFFTPATENVALSFAGVTAAHFSADYTVTGFSGLGVVRSLGSGELPGDTIHDYLDRTLALNPFTEWEYSQPPPDAVVINLGTNDFALAPHPDADAFVQAYVQLLQMVRQRYPEAEIFALAGPIMFEPANRYVETAVQQARAQLGDERMHYVVIENTLELSAVDYGCDWHPNVSGQRKIAAQLIPAMAAVLGWQDAEPGVE